MKPAEPAQDDNPILPPRPLRLSSNYVASHGIAGVALVGIAVAVGIGLPWRAWQLGKANERHAELMRTGVAASDVTWRVVSGRTVSTNEGYYTIEVHYSDQQGAPWTTTFEMRQRDGRSATPEVRYDPKDPSRVAVSWAGTMADDGIELARTFMLAIVGGLIAIWRGMVRVSEYRLARRCARESSEIVLELTAQEGSRERWARHDRGLEERSYRFRPLDGGNSISWSARGRSARPLFLDEAHTLALALRSPRGEILMLRADFSPLAFAPEEERALRERIEARRGVATA